MSNVTEDSKTTIKLMDKEFQIKCPAGKAEQLKEAAAHLDSEMRKMRASGVLGLDRITMMAALHIAYDYNITKKTYDSFLNDSTGRIKQIHQKIDDVLTHAEQLEIIE